MKVLLVDDSHLFLEGLESLLTSLGIEVVGTASDGLEALDSVRNLRPDVILMDIDMPRCNGLTATRLIHAELPEIKIVMLSISDQDEDLFEALKSGASGYLLKSLSAQELRDLLGELELEEPPLSAGLASKILHEFARQSQPGDKAAGNEALDKLTARQQQVLILLTQGLTYQEIGAALHLSERTIKYHVQQIISQLHLQNRAQVIAYAARLGLGQPRS